MTQPKGRFTAWLADPERAAIRQDAQAHDTSENHVLRAIIREHYGLTLPAVDTDKPERV